MPVPCMCNLIYIAPFLKLSYSNPRTMLGIILIFGLAALNSATPILERDDIASNPTLVFIPSPVTETIQLAGSPTDITFHEPIVEGHELPIDGTSYFYVSDDCFRDTRN